MKCFKRCGIILVAFVQTAFVQAAPVCFTDTKKKGSMKFMLSKKGIKSLCAGLLLAGLLSPAARGEAGEDQAWMRFWIMQDINKTVGVKVAHEDRFRDSDEDKYYYGYTDISVPVKLNDYLTLAPAVRQIHTLRGGVWRDDLMPHLTLSSKTPLGPVVLKNRMRLVRTDKDDSDVDPVQYRHRLDVVSAEGWTSWKLKPYVADEVFYDFTDRDLNQNRAYVGLLFSPVHRLSFDLYVMREDTKKANEWNDILVFGLITRFEF